MVTCLILTLHLIEIRNLIQRLNEQLHLTMLIDVLTFENIEKGYETAVIKATNPITKKNILLVSEHVMNQAKQKHKKIR